MKKKSKFNITLPKVFSILFFIVFGVSFVLDYNPIMALNYYYGNSSQIILIDDSFNQSKIVDILAKVPYDLKKHVWIFQFNNRKSLDILGEENKANEYYTGSYYLGKIYLYVDGEFLEENIYHELGHSYWYNNLTSKERSYWKELYEGVKQVALVNGRSIYTHEFANVREYFATAVGNYFTYHFNDIQIRERRFLKERFGELKFVEE